MNVDEDSFNYDMDDDQESAPEDSQESDQQQTQSTQQASQQPPTTGMDIHLWGYLQPCTPGLTRIDFWKITPRYKIGRNTAINQVVFPGFKVSNEHCVMTWDGQDTINSSVLVEDKSSNGTFINGDKIGKGQSRIVREGNEIAFGTCVQQTQNGGLEDYRFVYRHVAGGQPTEGLFAHYDLGNELGKGSFATVRKAVRKATGDWYAVKMIHPSKSVGQQQSKNQSLVREISIMEKLDHRNVCKLFEVFFQPDDSINLVLELVEGGDLLDYILKRGGLSEVDARDITYQTCDAMAYIHARGVTHRDLKPENILLTNHRPPIIKVADFGLAKVVDHETMLRTMCGTPSYLAPEVVSQVNNSGYDNLVDSWSEGVIVFSMIANTSPFLEDDSKHIQERILRRRIDWSTLRSKDPGEDAVRFIRALLEVNPTLRMSLTDALQHPWLKSHLPFYPSDFDESTCLPNTNSSVMSVSQEVANGAVAYALGQEDSSSQGSQSLQRRKDIISQANDGNLNLPEPSWEMVANVAADGTKGQNKRVHAELSTLPEDSLEQVYQASDAAKRAAAAEKDGEEDASGNPRRSTRRAKVARRG